MYAGLRSRCEPRWDRRAVLIVFAAVALAGPAAASADVMYWGGTIKGDTYGLPGEAPTSAAVLGRFEADAGKPITFVNTGQAWAEFDTVTMSAAIANGAIPLVTMPLAPGVTLQEVAEGKQDAQIRSWAQAAKAFGYPFLFRPWWEENGDWYAWGRNPEYIRAWRHFHDLVVAEGATNVTWAWVVNTIWSDPESKPAPWYPGDEYVDWVGMDAYNWGENPLQPDRWLTAEESIQPTLDELERIAPGKPVCICESASTEMGNGEVGEEKALWIHEMLTEYLPAHPQIKAYLWFNWNVVQEGATGRWDWPIESSPQAQAAFHEGIQGQTFLSVLPPLTQLAKVPMPAWPPAPAQDPAPPSSRADPAPPAGAKADPARASRPKPSVRFGPVTSTPADGAARLSVTVSGPGKLQLSGRGLRVRVRPGPAFARTPFSKWMPGAGRLDLEVAPTRSKLHQLGAAGSVQLWLRARFVPALGAAQKATTKVTVEADD